MKNESFAALQVDASGLISYICDPETYAMLYMSSTALKTFGLTSSDQYKGKKCHQILQGEDNPCSFCTNCNLTEGKPYKWEHFNTRTNHWFDITDTLSTVDGRQYKISTARDITARRDVHSPLPDNASTEDVMFRCLHVLSTEKDLHRAINMLLSYVGEYYKADRAHIFEIDREHKTFNSTFEWHREGTDWNSDMLKNIPLSIAQNLIRKLQGGGSFSLEPFSIELDGIPTIKFNKSHRLLVTPLVRDGELMGIFGISDPERNGSYMSLLRSVSEFILAELEKRRLTKELERLSYTDILTETANRNSYTKTVSEYLLNPPEQLGVISISLNGLKNINETFGQKYGDDLIVRAAKRILVHTAGTVYRVGGDEFIVFSPNLAHDPFVATVTDLIASFREEREFSVSIGYEWDCGADLNEQIHRAQLWMRSRKQHFYQLEFAQGRSTDSSAEDLLREVKSGCFEVWYQPQVDLHTGAIIGAEALVRKHGENGTLIPPGQFVPYYEARNVISHLDMFVLDTALGAIRQIRNMGLAELPISVNFSRATLLVPDFSALFHRLCANHNVSPRNITLEVTETVSALGRDTLQELLAYIHNSGLCLSLDDFGSKYSNLAILTDIEFDEIKFDKTLLDSICESRRSQIILKELIQMCRKLQHNIRIVVEGIETEEQAALLRDYDCTCAQGYYFHRPMPLEDLLKLLEQQHIDLTTQRPFPTGLKGGE